MVNYQTNIQAKKNKQTEEWEIYTELHFRMEKPMVSRNIRY